MTQSIQVGRKRFLVPVIAWPYLVPIQVSVWFIVTPHEALSTLPRVDWTKGVPKAVMPTCTFRYVASIAVNLKLYCSKLTLGACASHERSIGQGITGPDRGFAF